MRRRPWLTRMPPPCARSRELQRQFLSRLSHELRTPLTAIRGYASSLLAPDISWDDESQQRFLETIATESARLGRLVDDLLDFSAIESGVMRLQFDWCELDLVIDAAVACLPPEQARPSSPLQRRAAAVFGPTTTASSRCSSTSLNNALHHNPPGTRVTLAAGTRRHRDRARRQRRRAGAPRGTARRRRSTRPGGTARAPPAPGLGLSIARGIVGRTTARSSWWRGARRELPDRAAHRAQRHRAPRSQPASDREPDDPEPQPGSGMPL